MEHQWYYTSNGQEVGPESAAQLRTLAASGRLLPTDLVRCEGMSEWSPAASVKGLFPQDSDDSEPPPLPESRPGPAHPPTRPAGEERTSSVCYSAEPIVLTLGRGLVEMRLAPMLRGAAFVLGAFATVSLVRAFLGLWTNPLWLEFSRVASTVLAIGVVYFLLDGIVTLMSSTGQSGGVSLSMCVEAMLRDRRWKCAEVARYGIRVLGLEVAWIALLLLGMAPYVGKPIMVIAWPIRLLLQLGIWLLLARMALGAVLSPIVRGLKPDLDLVVAGRLAWQLVRENAFYWIECAVWLLVAIAVVIGVVNYLVFFEQSAVVYALDTEQAADLYGAAPLLLKAILVVPGLESPFGGVVAPPDSNGWSMLLSSLNGVLHFLVLFPASVLLFFLFLYPLRAAVRRLLAAGDDTVSDAKAPQS